MLAMLKNAGLDSSDDAKGPTQVLVFLLAVY